MTTQTQTGTILICTTTQTQNFDSMDQNDDSHTDGYDLELGDDSDTKF
jgi:hypothetical protein